MSITSFVFVGLGYMAKIIYCILFVDFYFFRFKCLWACATQQECIIVVVKLHFLIKRKIYNPVNYLKYNMKINYQKQHIAQPYVSVLSRPKAVL